MADTPHRGHHRIMNGAGFPRAKSRQAPQARRKWKVDIGRSCKTHARLVNYLCTSGIVRSARLLLHFGAIAK